MFEEEELYLLPDGDGHPAYWYEYDSFELSGRRYMVLAPVRQRQDWIEPPLLRRMGENGGLECIDDAQERSAVYAEYSARLQRPTVNLT